MTTIIANTRRAALLRGRSAAKERSSALRHKGERPFRGAEAAQKRGPPAAREFLHIPASAPAVSREEGLALPMPAKVALYGSHLVGQDTGRGVSTDV